MFAQLRAQFTSTLLGGTSVYRDQPATETLFDTLQGSPAVPAYINRMQYTALGQMLQQTQSELYNGTEILGNRITQTFDVQGRLIEYFLEQNNLTSIDPFFKIELSYDSYNQITREATLFYLSGAWTPIQIKLYQNTYQNNILVEKIKTDSLNPGFFSKYSYHYAGTGELDSLVVSQNATGTYTPWYRLIYPSWYNFPAMKPATEIWQNYNDSTLVYEPYYEMQYQYYSNDTLQEVITYYPHQTTTPDEVKTSRFHQDGFQYLDSTSYLVNLNPPTYEFFDQTIYYTFDQLGRLIQRISNFSQSNAPSSAGKAIYGYNATSTELALSLDLMLFPNPATEYLIIQKQNGGDEKVHLQLYDLAGRLRMDSATNFSNGEVKLELSNSLENGHFLLKISTPTGQTSSKIQILR